ncbi:MAG: hypothetical protein ACQ5SW_09605 [Sphaerochaetaceae bacterium]
MARNDIGSYWVGVGHDSNGDDVLRAVPAVVESELDASGEELEDQSTSGDGVDIIILGFTNGKRRNVAIGTEKNQFER